MTTGEDKIMRILKRTPFKELSIKWSNIMEHTPYNEDLFRAFLKSHHWTTDDLAETIAEHKSRGII